MKTLKLLVRLMFLPWILLHRFLSSEIAFLILQCIGTLIVGLLCGGIIFWVYASWGIYAAILYLLTGAGCSYGVYWLNRKWEIPKDAYFELNIYVSGLGIWPLYVLGL